MTYRKIAALKTPAAFLDHLAGLGIELPFEETLEAAPGSPLAGPLAVDGLEIGNRFAVLPMEGWDGEPDGRPSELTFRRWRRFGLSGAKLVWGGEAVAVRPDGRANPNQLVIDRRTLPDLVRLREALCAAHAEATGSTGGLVIGLQLTHSGRYSKPNSKTAFESRLAYDHPWLNPRVKLPSPSERVFGDDDLDALVEDFVRAAGQAQEAGFHFVDVKLCHGYLGHELLSAFERPGRYGGSFENRTRFPRAIIQGIQARAPGLRVGVRLSAFDFVPFKPGPDGVGLPDWAGQAEGRYPYAFGGDGSGLGIDLGEPVALVRMLAELGVHLVCLTAGSPYYVPHIQRPAYFPPSDGYLPPEDPMLGVARQLAMARQVKQGCPGTVFVGSAYTALQEWLPNVAQAAVRQGWTDLVGLGRMMLACPELPADVLAGHPLQRKRLCRTFSDCTTAPRGGLVSGCYPLDEFYKGSPQAETLDSLKRGSKQ
jgi:2,4-dienoyl-CoA reductase-like NADH-dependent reductase (Old Yellow Enzyme family)